MNLVLSASVVQVSQKLCPLKILDIVTLKHCLTVIKVYNLTVIITTYSIRAQLNIIKGFI